jgi:molybdate transport system ATP-binding protein
VDELLNSFGLAELALSRPHALSGGQQQRVALARALACAPKVLLLDEPFAALNPMLRQGLRQELAQACARWRTPVVMITHDVDDVLALADVAFVIEHGQVVREIDVHAGTAREVAQRLLPAQHTEPASESARAVRALLGASAHG